LRLNGNLCLPACLVGVDCFVESEGWFGCQSSSLLKDIF